MYAFSWIVFASSIGLAIFGGFTCALGLGTDPSFTMPMRAAFSGQGLTLMFVGTLGLQVSTALFTSARRMGDLERRVRELEGRQAAPPSPAAATQT